MSEPVVAGIDVVKETVEACWADRDRTFANDDDGHETLIAELRLYAAELVVMEASGGHEAACAYAVQAAGFPLAMVSPRQVRDFADPLGQLDRTDRIEARVLQRFAALLVTQPDRHKYIKPVPGKELPGLQALVARRRQLLEMLTAEQDRLAASHRAARPSIEALLRAIRVQLEPIDKQLGRHLPSVTPAWLRNSMAPRAAGPLLRPSQVSPLWIRSTHAK